MLVASPSRPREILRFRWAVCKKAKPVTMKATNSSSFGDTFLPKVPAMGISRAEAKPPKVSAFPACRAL